VILLLVLVVMLLPPLLLPVTRLLPLVLVVVLRLAREKGQGEVATTHAITDSSSAMTTAAR